MNTLILSKVSDVTITLAPEAIADRDTKLADSKSIASVTDGFSLEIAVESARDLKSILAAVEKTRTDVKAPVLELGRRIDSLAKEFIADVLKESSRIGFLINSYQAEEQRKREAEERARQAELQRIEDEKRKAEAELQKAEAAKSDEERKKKEAELAALKTQHAQTVVQSKPTYVPDGVKTKKVWRFEVVSIEELSKAMPQLCRIEANVFEINKALSTGMRECPGLRIWEETATQIR